MKFKAGITAIALVLCMLGVLSVGNYGFSEFESAGLEGAEAEHEVSANLLGALSHSKTPRTQDGGVTINAPGETVSHGHKTIEEDALSAWAQSLQQLQGRPLRLKLARFWQSCRATDNCDWQLAQLEGVLPEPLLGVLIHFEANQVQHRAMLGDELMSHEIDLEDKIARIKAINEQVFGDAAALLYADDYENYSQALSGQALGEYLSGEDFVAQFTDLALRGLVDNDVGINDGAINSNATKALLASQRGTAQGMALYEQGMSFIPKNASLQEQQAIDKALAKQWLSKQQQTQLRNRQGQIASQEGQKQDYQQAFKALMLDLSAQRQTTLAHLSMDEWLAYQGQQKAQFRQAFFTDNP
jgi:hypothetical protein